MVRRRVTVAAVLAALVVSVGAVVQSPVSAYGGPREAGVASRGVESSPQLEVKFAEDLRVRGAGTGLHSTRGQSLTRVREVLASVGATEVTPLAQGIAVERIDQLGDAARARSGRPAPDLAS